MKEKVLKLKLPLRRIISDNLFVLRLINKASPGLLLVELGMIVLNAVMNFLSGTFLFRYAINGIQEGKNFGSIALFAVCTLLASVLIFGFQGFLSHGWCAVRYNNANRYIHELVYKKAASVELARYENPEYYNILQKAVDECQNRTNAVINTVCSTLWRFITFSANIGLLISIDPVLLVFIIVPLLLSPLNARVNKLGYERTMDTKEVNRRRDYSRRAFYLSDYAKEMRLTNMPLLLQKRFYEAGVENIKILKKYGWSIAALQYIEVEARELFSCLGSFLYAIYHTTVSGKMGYGDGVVVIDSIGQVAWTLADSANVLMRFQENALYIENLRDFLSYETAIKSGEKPLPCDGDLVLKNVSFRYDGASEYTLKNINMKIGAREKIAIVGHNGAGKTTLTKLLLRLYDCEGSITYGGTEIREFPVDDYRDIFAAVMQDYHIFALSVKENVMLRPLREGDNEVVLESLTKSGLFDKTQTFSDGVNTVLTREFDDNGQLLSGGEQQKLAISHVYSKQNRFVILDEPSSALDPIAEYEMYNRMNEACKDCGMIFISHRLSSAVMADRIYLLENGEVLECGSHVELMAKNGRYAEMFRRQAENYAEVE